MKIIFEILGAIGAIVAILTMIAVFGLKAQVQSVVNEQNKANVFFDGLAQEGQNIPPNATTSPAAPQGEKDKYALALAALRSRWAGNGSVSVAPVAESGSVPQASNSRLNRTVNLQEAVDNYEAVQEAARIMRSDECNPKAADTSTRSFPALSIPTN